MASIEPELWVERAASAARFYSDAFGATVVFQVGEGEDVVTRLDVDGARFWVAAADSRIRRRAPDEFQGATGRVLLVLPDPAAVVVAVAADDPLAATAGRWGGSSIPSATSGRSDATSPTELG